MRHSTKKLICRVAIGAAVLVYLAALALAIIGTQGLFGVQPDGLAAIWLIFVGMPWSLIVTPIALLGMPIFIGQILAVLLPIVNIVILIRICRSRHP